MTAARTNVEIEKKLKRKVPTVGTREYTIKARDDRSAGWKTFGIVHRNGKAYQRAIGSGYAACFTCNAVYIYSKKTGASTMSDHKCIQTANATSSILEFTTQGTAIAAYKSRMKNALVQCCAFNIRPFSIVEGEGFRAVLQAYLDIGLASHHCLLVR